MKLSARNKQVLDLVLQEKPNKQIAEIVGISERGVEKQRKKLYDRAGATTILSLYLYCVKHGICPPPPRLRKRKNALKTPKKMEKNNESIITCKVEMVLETPDEPAGKPKLKEISYDLRFPKPGRLREDAFLKEGMVLTQPGVKMVSSALIYALVSNIKAGHTMGLWDRTEHAIWMGQEIEKALASDGELVVGDTKFHTPD